MRHFWCTGKSGSSCLASRVRRNDKILLLGSGSLRRCFSSRTSGAEKPARQSELLALGEIILSAVAASVYTCRNIGPSPGCSLRSGRARSHAEVRDAPSSPSQHPRDHFFLLVLYFCFGRSDYGLCRNVRWHGRYDLRSPQADREIFFPVICNDGFGSRIRPVEHEIPFAIRLRASSSLGLKSAWAQNDQVVLTSRFLVAESLPARGA
jgi:hypothetical protein